MEAGAWWDRGFCAGELARTDGVSMISLLGADINLPGAVANELIADDVECRAWGLAKTEVGAGVGTVINVLVVSSLFGAALKVAARGYACALPEFAGVDVVVATGFT